MIQNTKHLLKVNGTLVSSLRLGSFTDPDDRNTYFLDNTFGWLILDDRLVIEVCYLLDPKREWKKIDVETLLTLSEKSL